MTEPSNKTILLLDVEGSGSRRDTEVSVIRRMSYAVLHETLSAASVEPTEYRCEDRGDGMFILIDPSVPKPALIRALLTTAADRLVSNNRLASPGAQIRMRMVLHTGEVALDEYGAIGGDVVHAFRLLDSPRLKEALRATSEPSVLCVSDAVHRGVVRHAHPGVRPEHFHLFTAKSKEGPTLKGWYHDSTVSQAEGDPERAGEETASPPSSGLVTPPAPEPPASAPTPQANTGNFFLGTVHFGGDAVAGDKHMHGRAGR
ncbi:hypothetical protein ACGILS_20335 [Streptomyces albidoflavus]|uniref:hypothetical protein n=1 Tax=Streptomyces albidoflavus TaxID=1886 RepID=UPI0021D5ED2A|nr:hypothetical protein [Streptomyces albidoflavus]MCU7706453.1 hypothetical protein [Streptomyces albidoflavus]